MTDYIERDELVSCFKEIATKTLRDGSVQCVLGAGVIAHMIVEIKEFPAADVRPVVRGKWIFDDPLRADFMCSACLERQIVCSNYCPYCGSLNKEDET